MPTSYEVGMDAVNFLDELTKVLLDAAARLQATAYTTGTGTGQPAGVITGATTSPVLTVGAFTAANIFALQNALPPRFSAGASFAANLAVINTAAQFETTAGALKFPEIREGRLLSRDLYELSDMTSDMATTNSLFLLYGSFGEGFVIADRVGATLELLPGYGAGPSQCRNNMPGLDVG